MAFEAHQRAHRHAELSDLFGAAQFRQIDDETGGQNLGADLLEKLHRRLRRAAGGDEIVDQNHALAFDQRVFVHFHFIDAVFERIADADALKGQFAFLADRYKATRYLVRNCTAENKTTRLDARHFIDLAAGPRLHQFVHRAAKRPRIAQERGDIPEHDPRLGIIRDRANCSLQVVYKRVIVHRRGRRRHAAQTLYSVGARGFSNSGSCVTACQTRFLVKYRSAVKTMRNNMTWKPSRLRAISVGSAAHIKKADTSRAY